MNKQPILSKKTKAIIITIVSIIAVLFVGYGIGTFAGSFLNNSVKAKRSTQTSTVAKQDENNTEENNEEEEKELILKVDEDETLNNEEKNEELTEEEKLKQQEQAELEKKKQEEEAKKQEEEKKKQQEEAKKKEEEKKKEENKTTVTTVTNNGYPYYIKVNYLANTVTVYGKDANGNYTVPVKAMICSTGRQTPHSGVYKTPSKARWGTLIGPVWGQYCTRIVGGILFHSVPYLKQNDPSSLEYWEYDRLGEARSLGCIRLTVADARWLYFNCPVGTSVEFYGSSNPGPLGKPSAQKVTWAGDPYKGWDPTDPDPNNPWRIKAQKDAEEAAKKKAEEEAKKKAEEEAKKKAEEEAKKKAEEEAKKKAEEEAKKKAEEEAKKKAEQEAKKKAEEEAKKKAEEEKKKQNQTKTNTTNTTNTTKTNTTNTTNTTKTTNKTN